MDILGLIRKLDEARQVFRSADDVGVKYGPPSGWKQMPNINPDGAPVFGRSPNFRPNRQDYVQPLRDKVIPHGGWRPGIRPKQRLFIMPDNPVDPDTTFTHLPYRDFIAPRGAVGDFELNPGWSQNNFSKLQELPVQQHLKPRRKPVYRKEQI